MFSPVVLNSREEQTSGGNANTRGLLPVGIPGVFTLGRPLSIFINIPLIRELRCLHVVYLEADAEVAWVQCQAKFGNWGKLQS